MPSWLVVLTCPREPSYVEATIASLEAGGAGDADRRLLLVDGERPPGLRFAGWEVEPVDPARSTPSRGSVTPLFRAFALAAAAGIDRLVVCEDDIVVCRSAVPRALALPIAADLAFVDFCDLKEMPPHSTPGIHVAPTLGRDGRGYHGNQMMAFPEHTIRYLAAGPRWSSGRVLAWAWRKRLAPPAGDQILGATLADSPWPEYGVHIPCLAQHVGTASTLGHGGLRPGRTATNFPGEEYDVLSPPRGAA